MIDNFKPKILLAEDEELLSDMYQMKFKKHKLNVVVAKDGVEALILARRHLFDLILLDVIMPRLDGFYVLKLLRKMDIYDNVPICMFTNLGNESDIEKAVKMGATDYWLKCDYTPLQLIERIKKILMINIKK